LLAQQGFSAAEQPLEGRHALLCVLGEGAGGANLLQGLGAHWELARIAFKPYPCAVVVHPAIDACLQLRRAHQLRPRSIDGIGLRLHPLALELAGHREPQDAMQAKLSVYYCAAAAFADGAIGIRQFQDDRIHHPRIRELAARVDVVPDASMQIAQAYAEVTTTDGRRYERHVRSGLGSLERPMSDAELSAKFRALAGETLATDQSERLLALAWNIRSLGDTGALIRQTVPEEEVEPAELPGSPLIPR
jgi:2-methylcitrate dehydratase PrpD